MKAVDIDLTALLEEYRAEAAEHLTALDTQLLRLDRDPANPAPIREMFLSAHTIKGAASLLELTNTRTLAHAVEDVLGWLRESRAPARREIVDLLFRAVDLLRVQVQGSAPGSLPPDDETLGLVESLRRQAAARAASPPSVEAADAEALRALVVEDSATVRKYETMLLTEAGFQVDAVAAGNQALDMALGTPFQLVVTSVETRGLRGLDLAAVLRSQPFYRSVPLILMSSDDNPEHRERAAEIGVHAYIRKSAFGDRRLLEAAREVAALRQTARGRAEPAAAGMKVLIADDDAVARSILENAIRAGGHQTTVVGDGSEAWSRFQGERFDVVISDWTMPGMEGPELCRRVRQQAADGAGYTYFILATSRSQKQDIATGMEAGADDYLTKPFDVAELQARLTVAQRVTSLYGQAAEQSAELQRLNHELFEQSRIDPLTQLGNRLRLNEDLKVLDARMQRYGHAYALAIFDVDHFKLYNDHYGHPEGDHVLRALARSVRGCCREGDTAYRYGGEEFVVILPEQTLNSAMVAMEHLRAAVEGLGLPHAARTPPNMVTISVGLAAAGSGGKETADALLKQADEALYRAKKAGRNRVVATGAPS
jgi:diguanylate cyclase (GGDEF)-like protein